MKFICNGTRTHNHFIRKETLNLLAKLTQMIELCCEYLPVRYIWLYVLIMSCARFRVNPHSIVAWISRNSSLDWPIWRNDWVFVYELNSCGFESRCSHVNFRFCACFEQGVPWHSGNYRVWIHSETDWRDMIRTYNHEIHLLKHLKHLFLCLDFMIIFRLHIFLYAKFIQAKFVTKKYNDLFKYENDKKKEYLGMLHRFF